MKNKTKVFLVLTVLVLVYTAIIAIGKFGEKTKINKEKESIQLKNMAIEMNQSWQEIKNEGESLILKHKNYDATIEARKEKLSNDYTEYDIEEVAEIVIENIKEQYKSYNILVEEKEIINGKEMYKILLGDEEYQALIIIYKENVNLFLNSYVASNDIFDILVDDALVMFYNAEYFEDSYEIPQISKVEATGINWTIEEEKTFNKRKEKEIYYDTYHAVLSVPEEFIDYEFSSKDFHYTYSGYSITGNILAKNVYEFILSDLEDTNLKHEYEYLQKYYENVLVESEFEQNKYVYVFDYNSENTVYQDAYIVYPLDNTHILKVKISSRNKKISKNLVNAIQLKTYDRYAKNIVYNSEKDGKNTFDFSIYDISYDTGIYYNVKLHLPQKYNEIDHNVNNQINRYFGYEYNEKKDEYLYNIQTQIYNNRAIKTNEKYIEEICGFGAKDVVIEKQDSIVINDKVFENYYLKYNIVNNDIVKTYEFSLLFLDITKNIFLVSKIDLSNVQDISQIINDFTDVDYIKKEYLK